MVFGLPPQIFDQTFCLFSDYFFSFLFLFICARLSRPVKLSFHIVAYDMIMNLLKCWRQFIYWRLWIDAKLPTISWQLKGEGYDQSQRCVRLSWPQASFLTHVKSIVLHDTINLKLRNVLLCALGCLVIAQTIVKYVTNLNNTFLFVTFIAFPARV